MSVNVYKNGGLVSIAGSGGGGGDVPIATVDTAGKVKPDGSSITITNDGTISTYDFVGTQDEVTSALNSLPNGTTIYITDDDFSEELPVATTARTGVVKPDGNTISITADGTISSINSSEETPIATTSVAGKVKPDGSTITITQDGTISGADATPIATTSVAGKVKPDGSTITISNDGTITASSQTVPYATTSTPGIIKPTGDYLSVNNQGGLIFDENNKQLNRNLLMSENSPINRVISAESVSSYQDRSELFWTVSFSGLYFISFQGKIELSISSTYADKRLGVTAWINLNNTTQPSQSPIVARGGGRAPMIIGLNASGLIMLRAGDKLYFSQTFEDQNQAFQTFSGQIYIYNLYQLNNTIIGGSNWWNLDSLPEE